MKRVYDDRDVLAYQQLEKVVPHAEFFLSSEDVGIEDAIDITNCLNYHHRKWGRYRQAEQFGRKSLELAEKKFEPGHPSIARRQSNLALVLQDLGELTEARDLLRKALASDEKNFEPGHPSIAISQSNLAMVLKALGELTEARDLLRKAYEAFLKKLGPDDPYTKTVRGHLDNIQRSERGS